MNLRACPLPRCPASVTTSAYARQGEDGRAQHDAIKGNVADGPTNGEPLRSPYRAATEMLQFFRIVFLFDKYLPVLGRQLVRRRALMPEVRRVEAPLKARMLSAVIGEVEISPFPSHAVLRVETPLFRVVRQPLNARYPAMPCCVRRLQRAPIPVGRDLKGVDTCPGSVMAWTESKKQKDPKAAPETESPQPAI